MTLPATVQTQVRVHPMPAAKIEYLGRFRGALRKRGSSSNEKPAIGQKSRRVLCSRSQTASVDQGEGHGLRREPFNCPFEASQPINTANDENRAVGQQRRGMKGA